MSNKSVQIGVDNLQIYEELYAKYRHDPHGVDPRWRLFFRDLDQFQEQPVSNDKVVVVVRDDHRIAGMILAYRTYGHLIAQANPLKAPQAELPLQLQLTTLGFSQEELTQQFPTYGLMKEEIAQLQQILDRLQSIYCGTIGYEYMEIHSPAMEQWLQQKIETRNINEAFSLVEKKRILHYLNRSELFEAFLHTKYVGQKRFSLEGGESFIPLLMEIIETGSSLGVEEVVLGMAHRGRLNVLSNIMNKSHTEIFAEFEEGYIPDAIEGSGDVKYHKGYNAEVELLSGKKVSIALTPNPSHLDSVDPVVEGQVLAIQILKDDMTKQEQVIPILVHGDAALSGQGVIYETAQMWRIPGYATGGTIHLVINNQIGFTTLPEEGRSTRYCTDLAATFGAPVFHVNGDDPEAVVFAARLAIELRQKFKCDVFIDLICYRKYGHNESDEPAFTQPLEYQAIRKKKGAREIYRDRLIMEGNLEKQIAENLEQEFKQTLQKAMEETKNHSTSKISASTLTKKSIQPSIPSVTSCPADTLKMLTQKICSLPEGFALHPKIGNLLKERLAMGTGEKPIDWGMAEMLAYASLVWEGTPVRLSGQDSARGTFSHRHAVWVDQKQERRFSPIANLKEGQARFDVYNSLLSEYAVLGFEFGYSLADPKTLTIWEAQFGDFCNGAQIIIDQYISSSEQKWGRCSGLTLLLPHGYEGQGPEHSSGRMERFLTLCACDNMRVCDPTTPAQFFHLLRSQALSPIKKPLIVFTPKGLLRFPECVSQLSDLENGAFEEVLDDSENSPEATRIAFCAGRFYYDLKSARAQAQEKKLAIIRIEQLYPLHKDKVKELLQRFPHVDQYYWLQEEPKNMGAWGYIHDLLEELLPNKSRLKYIGRDASASPAAGSYALHKQEHAAIMDKLFKRETIE